MFGTSPNTIWADLPPHSSHTGFMLDSAEYFKKRLPTSVEPVNESASTSGCRPSAAPAVGPSPGSTPSAPSGSPASCASWAMRNAINGVCSAGLRTTLLPAASAGASFHIGMVSGELQGVTGATTAAGFEAE